jgi:hypothetical protein
MRYRLRTLLALLLVAPVAGGTTIAALRTFLADQSGQVLTREQALTLAVPSLAAVIGVLWTAFDIEPKPNK